MNSAYQRGGPKQAIEALNTNLDLKITKYVAVDFNALVETIDLIGGVDIDVTPQEVAKINEYSGEVAQVYRLLLMHESVSWQEMTIREPNVREPLLRQ